MIHGNRKLEGLISHVVRRSQDDPSFDGGKLLLLLAFTDFLAYGRRGESITGIPYIKLESGPAPRDAEDVIAFIGAATDRDAALGVLSEDELRIADEVVEHYGAWDGSTLSEEARREFTGWRMVEEGEEIPYRSVFLAADQTPSPEAIEYGQKVAAELGASC